MSDLWPGDWMRGILEPMVLSVVSDGDNYGYLIASRIEDAGLGEVKGGSLYPLLKRLENDGLVVSAWQKGEAGPERKVYSLTDKGRSRLSEHRDRWNDFSARAGQVISGQPGESGSAKPPASEAVPKTQESPRPSRPAAKPKGAKTTKERPATEPNARVGELAELFGSPEQAVAWAQAQLGTTRNHMEAIRKLKRARPALSLKGASYLAAQVLG